MLIDIVHDIFNLSSCDLIEEFKSFSLIHPLFLHSLLEFFNLNDYIMLIAVLLDSRNRLE